MYWVSLKMLGKIRGGIIPDVRRILKNKIAEIRLFTRLSKPCKTLSTTKGGLRNEQIL
jgi:hypothetical protein